MLLSSLTSKRFCKINLAEEAPAWLDLYRTEMQRPGNPLLYPDICHQFVTDCHKKYDVYGSYGGWLEDRGALWDGCSIAKEGRVIHLGVDVYVPLGTPISHHEKAQVVYIDMDNVPNGWGYRIMLRPENAEHVLTFAHLRKESTLRIGDWIAPGDPFAAVGGPEDNGGWFPHLHVQVITYPFFLHQSQRSMSDVKGYCRKKDVKMEMERTLPPEDYVRIP